MSIVDITKEGIEVICIFQADCEKNHETLSTLLHFQKYFSEILLYIAISASPVPHCHLAVRQFHADFAILLRNDLL